MILISSAGIVIRISAETVNVSSRTSRGVNVMRVGDDETVVSAAPVAHEPEDDKDLTDPDAEADETDDEDI